MRLKNIKVFAFAFLMSACSTESFLNEVGLLSFLIFGDSVLNVDSLANLKDVHLDDERPEGERVIVSGKLHTRDNLKIYGVLEDESGKILTVFTGLRYGWGVLESEHVGSIRVMGQLETGQGGVRILRAEAVRKI